MSKWFLILGALERGWWPVAVVVLLASVLALVYVWRVVEAAYFRPFVGDEGAGEAPWRLLVPTWALVGANLYFGIGAARTAQVAERAAEVPDDGARAMTGGGA